MNPTACLIVKISILVALSCQVLGSDHFGGAGGLELLEGRLDTLRQTNAKLRRRQLSFADAPAAVDTKPDGTQPIDPTKADPTKTDPTRTDATNTDPTKTDGTKTDAKQAQAGGDTAAGGNNGKLSKEEQLATQLFEGIIEMGVGLDSVTNLGSTTKQIVDQSQKVSEIVPKVQTLVQDLLTSAPNKSDQLTKAVEASSQAGDALIKSLKVIEAKPDDANTIKQEFKNMENSFKQILTTSDGVAVAALPQLAVSAQKEGEVTKKDAADADAQKTEGKLQDAGAANQPADDKKAAPAGADKPAQ